jgi:UDP-glucose 4-epimerase
MNNKYCLITGGAGFIGRHLAKALFLDGWGVKVVGRSTLENLKFEFDCPIKYYSGSFSDMTLMQKIMPGVNLLVHLASTTTPAIAFGRSAFDVETNLIGTLNLLEQAAHFKVDQVIFASSGGTVYGNVNTIPIPESHMTLPISSHGIIKLAIENYIQMLSNESGFKYSVLRIANPYGPGQRPDLTQGVIAVMAGRVLENKPVVILGDGKVIRDFIYIDDLISAFLSVINSNLSANKIFNVGTGEGVAINDLIPAIEDSTGKIATIVYEKSRKFDVPINVLDITKFESTFNWSPKISLNYGIDKTVSWIKQNYFS